MDLESILFDPTEVEAAVQAYAIFYEKHHSEIAANYTIFQKKLYEYERDYTWKYELQTLTNTSLQCAKQSDLLSFSSTFLLEMAEIIKIPKSYIHWINHVLNFSLMFYMTSSWSSLMIMTAVLLIGKSPEG